MKAAKAAAKAKALAKKGKPAAAVDDEDDSAPPAKKPKVAAAELPVKEAPASRGGRDAAEPDPKTIRLAHKAIDLAKYAKWRDLFAFLDKNPEVVNIRPEEREYTILHQAAYHGSQLAVDQLIDKYGADKKALTKDNAPVADIATSEGYLPLAKHIEEL